MTCVDRSMSSVCQRCQSTDRGHMNRWHMDRGHIVSCHVVECHEVGYPIVIDFIVPRPFSASSFFSREYRTILGLLAEPRKR
jgi:hypothetical protein